MIVTGLICEYNPFHKGHFYHIEQARKKTHADFILVIMSGDYVQRGAPALFPKHTRAKMALSLGADIVLELPLRASCASAEGFARGAVHLLNALDIVDFLCFGAETDRLAPLTFCAKLFSAEPTVYAQALQAYLKQGYSFPKARFLALKAYLACAGETPLSSLSTQELAKLLHSPNNILAIEYLRALLEFHSPIQPVPILRKHCAYHENALGEIFSSATAVRKAILEGKDYQSSIPFALTTAYQNLIEKRKLVCPNDFSLLLKEKLLLTTPEDLTAYDDFSAELANRICRKRDQFVSWEQFCQLLHTKVYTDSRISRCLLHLLLGIRKNTALSSRSTSRSSDAFFQSYSYERILGFRRESSALLHAMKASSKLPLLTKLPKELPQELSLTVHGSDMYQSVITHHTGSPFTGERQQPIVIL